VRDLPRMRSLFARYRPRDVFHAAALKHVSLVEAAPCEAVKTNVSGTLNVAEAAAACEAERFVYISTDKAVLPASVMGATKRVGEELLRLRSRRDATAYCSVRFGNVLGSSGSVVEIFKKQIASGGPVTLTHPEVRRYFMGLSEAVSLVLYAAYGVFAELLVVDLNEQVRIADLATAMIVMAGLRPGHDVAVELIGLRPGEKLFETLLTEDEKRTRRIDRGLLAVDCPTPSANLGEVAEKLIDAANRDLDDRVIALLREAAPGYGRQDPAVSERKPSTLTPPGEPPTLDAP
jgi:FlaA1/EpsC-like NDP-sugar epimerase